MEYEADPAKIPTSDRYIDTPCYGRYLPRPDDFTPVTEHINSTTPESIAYWEKVLTQCDHSNKIYKNTVTGRDVFAYGSVIVKSSHLKVADERDHTHNDANEQAALALVRNKFREIRVPEIYFAGELNGRNVLIQERIPGVGLDVAWQYMSKLKKTFFKDQARDILQKLREIKPDDAHATLSYVVADPDPVLHRGISETEHNLLGTPPAARSRGISLMHNDMVKSNLIVRDGEIVGVIDWEMAGFFAWEAASVVHDKIRSPQAKDLQLLELDEETVKDRLFWNDLYHI